MTKNKVFAILTIAVLAGLSITIATFGALSNSKTIQSSGSVTYPTTVNVGVYSDSGCTNAISSFTWGSISPGSSTTNTVYIRNEGNVPVTLSLSTSGWSPSNANNYISLSWNAPTTYVAVNSVTTVTLTLTVSSSITGITSFSFNTVITGTQ